MNIFFYYFRAMHCCTTGENQSVLCVKKKGTKRDTFFQKNYPMRGPVAINIRTFLICYMLYKQNGNDLTEGSFQRNQVKEAMNSETYRYLRLNEWFYDENAYFEAAKNAKKKTSHHLAAMNKKISEYEINTNVKVDHRTDPDYVVDFIQTGLSPEIIKYILRQRKEWL